MKCNLTGKEVARGDLFEVQQKYLKETKKETQPETTPIVTVKLDKKISRKIFLRVLGTA